MKMLKPTRAVARLSAILLLLALSGVWTSHTGAAVATENAPAFPLTKAAYTHGKYVTVRYPQLLGGLAKDPAALNEMLKREALNVLKQYDPAERGLSLDIDYRVERNDPKLLSISYSGMGNVLGAAHPNNLFYTTNMDMANGKLVRLADYMRIDDAFIQQLKQKRFTMAAGSVLSPDLVAGMLNDWSAEELKQQLQQADSSGSNGSSEQPSIYSFITPDGIGISLPTGHATGDHYELLLSANDYRQWLLPAYSSLWKP